MNAYFLAALLALAPAAIIAYIVGSRTFFALAIFGAFVGGIFAPYVMMEFGPGVTDRDRIIAHTVIRLSYTTAGAILFGSLAWWTAESTRNRPPILNSLRKPQH